MAGKKHQVEEIIVKLWEAEVELGRGLTVAEVCRKIGVTQHIWHSSRILCLGLGSYWHLGFESGIEHGVELREGGLDVGGDAASGSGFEV
jgi:hypothetical protein